jgi:hypothetical protein
LKKKEFSIEPLLARTRERVIIIDSVSFPFCNNLETTQGPAASIEFPLDEKRVINQRDLLFLWALIKNSLGIHSA